MTFDTWSTLLNAVIFRLRQYDIMPFFIFKEVSAVKDTPWQEQLKLNFQKKICKHSTD